MARVAVVNPDGDRQDAARSEPSAAAARAMLLAELTGRRLEIRGDGGDRVARLTPWLRRRPSIRYRSRVATRSEPAAQNWPLALQYIARSTTI